MHRLIVLNYGENLVRSECILRCNLLAAHRSNARQRASSAIKAEECRSDWRFSSDWSRSMETNELFRFNWKIAIWSMQHNRKLVWMFTSLTIVTFSLVEHSLPFKPTIDLLDVTNCLSKKTCFLMFQAIDTLGCWYFMDDFFMEDILTLDIINLHRHALKIFISRYITSTKYKSVHI